MENQEKKEPKLRATLRPRFLTLRFSNLKDMAEVTDMMCEGRLYFGCAERVAMTCETKTFTYSTVVSAKEGFVFPPKIKDNSNFSIEDHSLFRIAQQCPNPTGRRGRKKKDEATDQTQPETAGAAVVKQTRVKKQKV